jgi:hypothetical protein
MNKTRLIFLIVLAVLILAWLIGQLTPNLF